MKIDVSETPYVFPALVIRVLDGDSIEADIDLGFKLQKQTASIRLRGIDTPETRTRNLLEKEAGLLVAEYVTFLIPERFTLISDEWGKFGRIIGTVLWDLEDGKIDLSAHLLEHGFAREYKGDRREPWPEDALEHIIESVPPLLELLRENSQ